MGGTRYENATGRKVSRGTEDGIDFVDPEVGPVSLKGPLADKKTGAPLTVSDEMVEGFGKSVVKDVKYNTATKRVVVDTRGMTSAQRTKLKQSVSDGLADSGATKEVVFLE